MLTCSCVRPAPKTQALALGDPRCDGTERGKACVTLTFAVDPGVRTAEKYPLKGPLHWGLDKAGDVSLLGPGSNPSVYGGAKPNVDLSADDATQTIVIPNAIAESYQVLGYLDVTGEGGAGVATSGDPVTFPSDPIPVPANQETQVSVVFDFIR